METKAHYALVGFFAIAITAAAALFVVWLGQFRFDQEFKEFDVVFQGPVRGLSETSEVRFNGIKVGEVTDVGLDPQDATRVVARIRIEERTPVARDSYAQLELQGLTGLSYVQLNPGPVNSDPLIPSRSGEVPRLSSRPALTDALLSSGEDIAVQVLETLGRVNDLLSPDNRARFETLLTNAAALSTQLAEGGDDAVVPSLRRTIAQIEETARDIDTLVTGDLAVMVEQTTLASQNVDIAAQETAALLQDMHGPVTRFSNDGLDELTLAIGDLRRVLDEIEAIAAGVEESPAAFVAGARREEVEIPR